MDSSFTIKPLPGARKGYASRDPVTVREAVSTDLDAAKTVTAATHDSGAQHRDQHLEHAPQDLLADPDSRDVIYRERDVRGAERELPD